MQLKSDNRKWYRNPTVMLSTVKLPPFHLPGEQYESCLFAEDGSSEVIARYSTFGEATEGHRILTERFGLK
jgi:hypothetical protein